MKLSTELLTGSFRVTACHCAVGELISEHCAEMDHLVKDSSVREECLCAHRKIPEINL